MRKLEARVLGLWQFCYRSKFQIMLSKQKAVGIIMVAQRHWECYEFSFTRALKGVH